MVLRKIDGVKEERFFLLIYSDLIIISIILNLLEAFRACG